VSARAAGAARRSPLDGSSPDPAGVTGVAVVVGAIALLLLRTSPALASVQSAGLLGLAYGLILAAGALVSAVTAAPGTAPSGRAGASAACLVVGVGALALARLIVAPAPPIRATLVTTALAVLAGVAEEALFRGAAFRLLERRGAALAVAGSALVFALIHVPAYGWPAFPVDLGAGLLFSWQRLVTGRWSVPAATHAAANLLAVMR
jgi:membrane protease YdiL (CAAX protease family)